jgi:hypothetical protein
MAGAAGGWKLDPGIAVKVLTRIGDRWQWAGRLLRLVLVAGFIAVVVVTTATADPPAACTHGVSSIGPVTLTDGHLTGDTTPHTEACLP